MLIIQNSAAPANIRNAVVDLISQNTTELRVASAYVTCSGSDVLLNAVANSIGDEAFVAIPKMLVTSFDFGLTEPQALQDWLNLENSRVLIAGAQRLEEGSFQPARAFHPKIYAFGKDDNKFSLLVGSANLTGRGFSVNSEAAWAQHDVPAGQIDSAFERTCHETVELSNELLKNYKTLRQVQPPPEVGPEAEPVTPPAAVLEGHLPLFRTEIEAGTIVPTDYDAMWVHGEGLQGGSKNQLELPRGGHKFFGFHFDQYDYPHNLTIDYPILRSGARNWDNRPLTWHGNNRMERLNLPTLAQDGFNYTDSGVMFRRLPDGSFELIVTPWESDLARAWRQASAQRKLLFRLGKGATNRLVGMV
ncbi:MAG: phospholipase D family protein [Nitrospinae bacterium]|nr:phospholipase D family protein [Nitrospinota bacterium]